MNRSGDDMVDDISTETNATMTVDKGLMDKWAEVLHDCPINIEVREGHCSPEPLILTSYVITEDEDMYYIELRPEDAQRVAEFLAKGG